MKIETWNGHNIRFVEHNGEWWAVAVDVCTALGLKQVSRALKGLNGDGVTISKGIIDSLGREQESNIVSELAIYHLIFKSRKKEAVQFQDWAFGVLKTLRKSTGLEGFEVFRMLDKEHQREAMNRLNEGLDAPVQVDFIKANTIANKAISTRHGHPKMIKKSDMPPEMLTERQPILNDTVELMTANEKFGLNLSVSGVIYRKYCG